MKKEPWLWDITDVQRLIDEKEKEGPYLEYKACAALDRSEESKNEVSKDISAFANAGGGIIIYGVNEKGNIPTKIDEGYDPKIITREWLEQVIKSRIHRSIEGLRINQIDLGEEKGNRVIYVVWIPQSDRAPHQAADKKFYTRRNFSSIPMEEYEIRDVFMRKSAPDLTLDFFFRRFGARIDKFPLSLVNPETMHTLEINGVLRNEGGGEVQYAVITLVLDARLTPETSQENIVFRPLQVLIEDKEFEILRTDINWGGPSKMPLFKTVEYLLLEDEINIHFKAPWLEEKQSPFLQWEIRAPGMDPKRGFLMFRLDGNEIYFKPEELPTYSEILQDGRNRDILRKPDLSISPELK